ncbi:unnamed protein product [Scytosiphon promiscuus]
MGVERSGKNGSFQTIGQLLSGRKMDEQQQRSRDDMRQSLVGEGMGSSFAVGQSRSNSGVGLGMASGGPLRGKQDRQELARRNLTITITCTSCMLMLYGYDFGITAWSVLLIKARGAEGVSDLYYYLATHGEALGMLVASAAVGGFAEGVWGSKEGHEGCGIDPETRPVRVMSRHISSGRERKVAFHTRGMPSCLAFEFTDDRFSAIMEANRQTVSDEPEHTDSHLL